RVFEYSEGSWLQMGQDIIGESVGDNSGWSISLSFDGTVVVIGAPFNDEISSVRLYGNARAKLCRNTNMNGTCRTYNNSRSNLHGNINNRASSVQVFTGTLGPVTFSTGPIILPQTFTANLDNGSVGGAGADILYQAVTPAEKYLKPLNGAQLSVSGTSNRGFAGCSIASFSPNRVPLWSLPVGSYVCVKTNAGRISEFRLNGYNGTDMKIGYTTWKN
ncbi:MAG: hypothetical protein L3J13_07845, partial [Devosiaceae bacterium]|nr:hypothetical protein [Devosiaceae bacterium]